ncbi:hypothetical protein BHE74_00052133 [Ensete ventricosum]|uniref:Uncharacterized protein n=1 Tax=Ensete ventricosum TaxID=4639 RepID=A0A444FBX6_ENSVE|nr:hypothetical protein B296_00050990 [Ensete ventricosum]RWW20097.1 hypothetical protein GW17_00015815 [Ensete ventricosum]RWW42327.1 hypothetical protein BHE74_00052133 [Ensete ventricosum]RZS24269.1 hypothetical protein BHM03_00057326 [Ensete ventricosum]
MAFLQEKFLTPEFIKQFQNYICSAPMLILDANLHPKSIEFACQNIPKQGLLYRSSRYDRVVRISTTNDRNANRLSPHWHAPAYHVFFTVAAAAGIPVWFEPVSVKKSTRIATVVNYVSSRI